MPRGSDSRFNGPMTGAKAAPFPGFITPCDPMLREQAPEGAGWLHEIKIDGYRAQLHIHGGRIRVYSRSGYDWTEQFHQIAQAARALASHDLIIDPGASRRSTSAATRAIASSTPARRAPATR